MKLSKEQIKEIATGIIYVSEEEGVLRLHRFTQEQEEYYKGYDADFYNKTSATAGVKFRFKTDSSKLSLSVVTSPASRRKFFSIDVFVNGEMIDCLDNYAGVEIPKNYVELDVPLGEFSKTFDLGTGEKEVCIHFPFSVRTLIKECCLDDGAFVKAVKQAKKLLAFGDSITHGYDALRPSNRYVAKLAEALDAEEFNKGIGGERICPNLAACKEPFAPDYITVAYGTNDWNVEEEETFRRNSKLFYQTISQYYPDAKIFAITPIWRKDHMTERKFGAFEKVAEDIAEAVKDLPNVTLVSGFDFVPHSEDYFSDLVLHPTDEGFDFYYRGLKERILDAIEKDINR